MTSPDFSEYIDLTVNDAQPPDIYTDAVEYAQTALPEFSPRTGTVEDAMLQAMSYVSGLVTGAINRLPNGLMEGILGLLGFTRVEDTFATGAVIFTSIDDTGLTIPVGTQVAFTEASETGSVQYIFETTSGGQISIGETSSAPVPVIAVDTGELPAIADGASMLMLSASNKIFSVTFSGSLTQGVVGESDTDYFTRGSTFLQSLSSSLATTGQVTSYVLSNYGEAFRATTYDLTETDSLTGIQIFESGGLIGASLTPNLTSVSPPANAGDVVRIYGASPEYFNGIFEVDSVEPYPGSAIYFTNTVGASSGEVSNTSYTVDLLEGLKYTTPDDLGSVSIVVSSNDGTAISPSVRSAIQTDVRQKMVAGLSVSVIDALVVPITVNIAIGLADGFSELDVRTAVDTAVSGYLSASQWDWSSTVRLNTLVTQVAQIAGVGDVESLTMSLDASENLAYQGVGGDITFLYRGVLPSASVTVGVV
jgi:hypothetical protein